MLTKRPSASTQTGCHDVASTVPVVPSSDSTLRRVMSSSSVWTMVATTSRSVVSPVVGSVALTLSPMSTSEIGLVDPSAINTGGLINEYEPTAA
ncbi:hypothetical protein F4560_000006 [Saccharothrix ecbatanensis]|uniref:Uncharacterized protein n=1 Tax=Saccharothrix ecbatanensis TaxID=1105145 RepID=A0A7W9HDF2_9PSEU|nr:hypothetical protein [Saccharothrix ecbatanensis]MBB5800238.1 hypothetical protein [Saccharothrix ecbatanensis]